MIKAIEDIILIGALAVVALIAGYGIAKGSEAVEIWREQDDKRAGTDAAEGD